MQRDAKEIKSALVEIAQDEGWDWERLDAAVCAAMRDIEADVEASACGYERADQKLMRRQERDNAA